MLMADFVLVIERRENLLEGSEFELVSSGLCCWAL
jgi:hypothetical protein